MFAVIASVAFVGAAFAVVVSGDDVGGSGGGGVVEGEILGPAGIIRPNKHEQLVMIFSLMAERRVHLELGARSS
jgi:hypothetical protein